MRVDCQRNVHIHKSSKGHVQILEAMNLSSKSSFESFTRPCGTESGTLQRFLVFVVSIENCTLLCQSRHHTQRVLTCEVSGRSTKCRQSMARDLLNASTRSCNKRTRSGHVHSGDVCGRDAFGRRPLGGLCRPHSRKETELKTIVSAATHVRSHSRPTLDQQHTQRKRPEIHTNRTEPNLQKTNTLLQVSSIRTDKEYVDIEWSSLLFMSFSVRLQCVKSMVVSMSRTGQARKRWTERERER